MNKKITIDEVCGCPKGSFRQFILDAKLKQKLLDDARKLRIKNFHHPLG